MCSLVDASIERWGWQLVGTRGAEAPGSCGFCAAERDQSDFGRNAEATGAPTVPQVLRFT